MWEVVENLSGLGEDGENLHDICNAVLEELSSARKLPNTFELGLPGKLLEKQVDRCKETIEALQDIFNNVEQITGPVQQFRRLLALMGKDDKIKMIHGRMDDHKQNPQVFVNLLNT